MEDLKLTFVNVGYGEAMILECPDPHFPDGTFVMVIDGGSAEASEFAGRSTGRIPLSEYLSLHGFNHIDLMVSTHIHEDHLCGLLAAAEVAAPAVFWQTLPPDFDRLMFPLSETLAHNASQDKFLRAINDYQSLCSFFRQRNVPIRTLCAGDCGTLCEGLTYQVLAPSPEQSAEQAERFCALFQQPLADSFLSDFSRLDSRMNNFSLMLLLNYRGTRLLLPGDTNYLGYDAIKPADLRADLFKLGHHGQKDGADSALLAAIRPSAVVCCASSDRRYNSAHPDLLRMLADSGAQVFFSDCPRLPELDLPPHSALTFTVGASGALSAQYIV